ncbi:MAG: efflux RND transporter periplasmic adaptor subunit [Patescibacteria group bacterium]|nr:efflux RND transporter periplasmic adaptor subunit [Patescibacteria group bacterium]
MTKFSAIFKKIRRRWYLIPAIVAVVFVLVYRFMLSSGQIDKKNAFKLKKQTLTETLSLSGSLDAWEKASLRFQTSGYLSWVGVKEGDVVKKYQTLASLDQRSVQKNLQKDLNDYLTTRWKFEQTKEDYKNTIVTSPVQRILDESQFGLNNSVLDVELQNLSVEYSNLWSPIDGLVTHIDSPNAGINITPAQAEFDVVNPKTIYFLATADQTDVVNLKNDMKGKIVLDSYPDKEINGKIKEISFTPKTDETGTVYAVKIFFNNDNSDYYLRLGMTGDVEFVTREKKNTLAVPTANIQVENGRKFLYKAVGKGQKKVYPKFGEEIGDYTEIKSGLEAGDIVY